MLATAVLAAAALAAQSGPAHASVKLACDGENVRASAKTTGAVRHVDFIVAGKRVARDRTRPYVRTLKRASGKLARVDVRFQDGRTIRLVERAPRC
ncbi:MAG TPA: hypothetical protein VGW10_14600 [Solirubrobacteraceae bacterium]|nr:hypothetical protein [Solirubrobacteraceae bacterium]